jgi:hypothetical protein
VGWQKILTGSSKISNSRNHYAHGRIEYYAGNGYAFLCAGAARRFLDGQRCEQRLLADREETKSPFRPIWMARLTVEDALADAASRDRQG